MLHALHHCNPPRAVHNRRLHGASKWPRASSTPSCACRAVQFGEHTEAARRAQRQQAEAVAAAQQRRRMAAMVVPTDDRDVRSWLRRVSEPVTLFGERAMERRERLRALLAKLPEERREALQDELMRLEVESKAAPQERFFTEGPPELPRLRRCVPLPSRACGSLRRTPIVMARYRGYVNAQRLLQWSRSCARVYMQAVYQQGSP
jgi:pre-mRNA processing factor 4 (PRP4) like